MKDTSSGLGRSFGSSRSDSSSSKGNIDTAPKKQPTILIKTREPTTEDILSKAASQKEETKTSTPAKENEGKIVYFVLNLYIFFTSLPTVSDIIKKGS